MTIMPQIKCPWCNSSELYKFGKFHYTLTYYSVHCPFVLRKLVGLLPILFLKYFER